MVLGALLIILAGAATAVDFEADEWGVTLQGGRNAARAGRYEDAEKLFQQAVTKAEQEGNLDRIANSSTHLGAFYRERERPSEAEGLFVRALELYRATGDNLNLARALNNLASVYQITGRGPDAEKLYREALERYSRGEPDDAAMVAAMNMALLAGARADYREQLQILEQARERWCKPGMLAPGAAGLYNQLGVLYKRLGRLEEAEATLRKALELRLESGGEKTLEIATTMNNLGDLLTGRQKYSEAEKLLSQASKVCLANLPKSGRCASMVSNLGSAVQAQGRFGEAEMHYRDAVEIASGGGVASAVAHAAALNNLGKLLVTEQRLSEAKTVYSQALAVWKAAQLSENPDYASTLTNYSMLQAEQKNYPAAQEGLRRALEIDEQRLGKDHWKVAIDLTNLATLLSKRKRFEEAEPMLERVLQMARAQDPQSSETANAEVNLGELRARQQRFEEAAAHYQAGFDIWDRLKTSWPQNQLSLLLRYEQILRTLKEFARAEEVAARAMRIQVRAAIEKSFVQK